MQENHLSIHLKTKEGYKQLRPLIKQLSTSSSRVFQLINLIKQTLSSKTTTAQMKLYSLRLAKDCVEAKNAQFMKLLESDVAPLIQQIAMDSVDREKQANYISDSGQINIENLKNLFMMALECIENWKWVSMGGSNEFEKVYQRLRKRKVNFSKTHKFFKESIVQDFDGSGRIRQSNIRGSNASESKDISMSKVDVIMNYLHNLKQRQLNQQQLKDIIEMKRAELDQVLEDYISSIPTFDEKYINDCYTEFEVIIKQLKRKQKGRKSQHNMKKKQSWEVSELTLNNNNRSGESSEELRSFLAIPPKQQKAKKAQNDTKELIVNNIPQQFVFLESFGDEQKSDEEHEDNVLQINSNITKNKTTNQQDKISSNKVQKSIKNNKGLSKIHESPESQEELFQSRNRNTNKGQSRVSFSVVGEINKSIYERQFKVTDQNKSSRRREQRSKSIHNTQNHHQHSTIQLFETNKSRVDFHPSAKTPKAPLANNIQQRILPLDTKNSFQKNMFRTTSQNQSQLKYFKQSILTKSKTFFQNSTISISKQTYFMTVNNNNLYSMKLTFNTHKNQPIITSFSNTEQIDIWIKPLSKLSQIEYQQELIFNWKQFPFNFIEMKVDGGQFKINCPLPILYFNFLKVGEMDHHKFNRIFENESRRVVKSSTIDLNTDLVGNIHDFRKYFDSCYIATERGKNQVEIAFLEQEKDLVLMSRIVMHGKSRAEFQSLELADFGMKYSKELNQNLGFLFSP